MTDQPTIDVDTDDALHVLRDIRSLLQQLVNPPERTITMQMGDNPDMPRISQIILQAKRQGMLDD